MKRISLLGLALAMALVAFSPLIAEEAAPLHPVFRVNHTQNLCVLKEQRDEKYHRLLRVSVKIAVQGSAGSGTICHYEPESGWAYIVSCGHLWSGEKAYDPKNPSKAKVVVWYKDGPRLEQPESYDAEVLFWSNARGRDSSLLRFRPDWTPAFAPVAKDFRVVPGESLNSMGCDGGREVARYEVVVKGFDGTDLETKINSPRPGRSGGGLLTDDCQLIGVCWGTSDTSSGDGTGFFTPLPAIKQALNDNDHSWLLNAGCRACEIPVLDHDRPNSVYDRHFVPMPGR